MIARPFRLRTAADFNKTYQRGRSVNADHMYLKYYQSHRESSKVAVVVSKKVSKRAVVRNRCKRRVIECIRKNWAMVKPGYNMVITIKQDISALPANQVQSTTLGLLQRANIWNENAQKSRA